MYVQGDYAYVTGYTFGLAIINISDPTNPGTPIYVATATSARNIHIQADFAYVAGNDFGMAIINISDPTSPGTPIYVATAGNATSVHVQGNYAYIASEDFGMAIINVSDPLNPGMPIYVATAGHTWSVYVNGNYAYVADRENGLTIVDISDPIHLGVPRYTVPTYFAWNAFVYGDYVYVADSFSGLMIMEVAEQMTLSTVQSIACHTSKGFVQNVTLYANQTLFPNTSINYQISTDGNTWVSITLNKTYSFAINPYHELYWRAILEAEDPQGPSPHIDSIMLVFDVYYVYPRINLINVQNNTAISPKTVIEFSLSNFSYSWFNWDGGSNFTLSEPWTITSPINEDYHWLVVYANDSVGLLSTERYLFYVNHPPLIEIQSPLNDSTILSMTMIEFQISDLSFTNAWYQWNFLENNSLTVPFIIQAPNSTGTQILLIGARDIWNHTTIELFSFYVISSTSIETIHQRSSLAYSGINFVLSFTITNNEVIPLNLTLTVFSTDDDVLTGNGSQLVLHTGDNWTIDLEILPKHASIHQLDIYLFHEDLLFYNIILEFNVAPQWMSPTVFLPLLVNIVLLLFAITVLGFTLLSLRNHFVIRRLYDEHHSQLTQLIDQLTISDLETTAAKEAESASPKALSARPLGFPQNLNLSEPLDKEGLLHRFDSLQEQIVTSDPGNLHKLSKLLTQAEELVTRSREDQE